MLLTITTTYSPATDLGYLLHKNPERVHEVKLSFGTARVFYPEASEARCTAALVLDVDPIGLIRGPKRSRPFSSVLFLKSKSPVIFNSTAHPMTPPTFTIKSERERMFLRFCR